MSASQAAPTEAERQAGLAELEAELRRDLDIMCYPGRPWLTPRETSAGDHVHDVLIIGGGQGGLALAFGLMHERIENILVIDDNPEGLEGPWLNFARMITLRTPKHLTGPDHGLPNLSPRAWWEAQHGRGSWARMGLVPKEEWARYLRWYRGFLGIPVRNEVRAGAVAWDEAERCLVVPVSGAGAADGERLYARRVVFANGIDGSGVWAVPPMVTEALDKRLYAHTREPIDFDALVGRRVGVLGAGASAFDNASVALERGAAEVHLYFRREKLPNINPYRWAEFVGFLKHHADLDDANRWRFIRQIIRMGQLPPTDTYLRATKHEAFHLHPGTCIERLEDHGDHLRLVAGDEVRDLDFLICGTGFVTDVSRREEWAKLHPHVALWGERYTPPAGEEHADLARHPYLGSAFELQEKTPGEAPWLERVYNYTFGCILSMGFGGGSISGMKYGQQRLIDGITRSLYREDAAHHYRTLLDFDLEEFAL